MTKKEFMKFGKVKKFSIIHSYHRIIKSCYCPEVRDDLKVQIMKLIFNHKSVQNAECYDRYVYLYGDDWCRYEKLMSLPYPLSNFFKPCE